LASFFFLMGFAQLAFELVGELLVVVETEAAPTAEEWVGYLEACRQLGERVGSSVHLARTLIFTDGGMPDFAQRRALSKIIRGRLVRSALVTDNIFIRMTLGGFSIINPALKVYPTRDWPGAATVLGLDANQRAEALAVADQLALRVGPLSVLRSIAR
jgi:hypothetical protein